MSVSMLPVRSVGPFAQDPLWITLSVAVNVLLIGIPIALFARAAFKQQPAGS